MKDQVIQKIQTIFREVFDDPDLIVNDELNANHIDMWDSLTHIDMVVMVEEEFDIVIPEDNAREFSNAGDLINYIIEVKG